MSMPPHSWSSRTAPAHATTSVSLKDRIQEVHDARDALEKDFASIATPGAELHSNAAVLTSCTAGGSVNCVLALQCYLEFMEVWHEREAEEGDGSGHACTPLYHTFI